MTSAMLNAGAVVLSLPGEMLVLGSGVDANGQPFKTYRKDLIRTGTWTVPQTGRKFTVTQDDLRHWRDVSLAMNTNGVKIPVPAGHTSDPDKQRGFASGFSVEGDTLFAQITLVGEDAIKMASTNQVSIYQPEFMVDGKGNRYERPIAHVALTPSPVISGQGEFIPIAASRTGEAATNAHVLVLERTPHMHALLLAIASTLSIPTEGKDEAALGLALDARCKELVANDTALALANDKIKGLELARPPTVAADILDAQAETMEMKLDALVEGGFIVPAVLADLKPLVCGKPGARNGLMLSRTAATAAGLPDAFGAILLGALKKNDPKVLCEQTKANNLKLSRTIPDDDGSGSYDPAEGEKRAKAALGIA